MSIQMKLRKEWSFFHEDEQALSHEDDSEDVIIDVREYIKTLPRDRYRLVVETDEEQNY